MEQRVLQPDLLQSRRLLPNDGRNEGNSRSTTTLAIESDESNRLKDSSRQGLQVEPNSSPKINRIERPNLQRQNQRNTNKRGSRPRRAFDNSPFYNEVKPHVTTQKRIRYVHLEEENQIEKKRMPKEMLDGPKIYEAGDVRGNDNKEEKRSKVPISLNSLFCEETSLHELR